LGGKEGKNGGKPKGEGNLQFRPKIHKEGGVGYSEWRQESQKTDRGGETRTGCEAKGIAGAVSILGVFRRKPFGAVL